MLLIPIRTECDTPRTPYANYALIGLNLLIFIVLHPRFTGSTFDGVQDNYFSFFSDAPALWQFFTYQFAHADGMHILANMLFLWLFGNGVNAKMGHLPYILFYLAGGVFAAWGHAIVRPEGSSLIGASGAIAAITTAYLVLFPRSRVTVLFWVFLFIHTFEWPAMILIGVKIIVWDNIVAPHFGASERVAYDAHLAGYLFGFIGALVMLLFRALPRDQFDLLALWKRWNQRRQIAAAMANPATAAQMQYGTVARPVSMSKKEHQIEDERLDRLNDMRDQIGSAITRKDLVEAVRLYRDLLQLDPAQSLSERAQLTIARTMLDDNDPASAAAAYDRFLRTYPRSHEAEDVRLLLGIIYARDLRRYEEADVHLTESWNNLRDENRRAQCLRFLQDVRAGLGRPSPLVAAPTSPV